jgi:hypothetical protein
MINETPGFISIHLMGMNFDVKKRIWDCAHSEKIDLEEHGFSLEV